MIGFNLLEVSIIAGIAVALVVWATGKIEKGG